MLLKYFSFYIFLSCKFLIFNKIKLADEIEKSDICHMSDFCDHVNTTNIHTMTINICGSGGKQKLLTFFFSAKNINVFAIFQDRYFNANKFANNFINITKTHLYNFDPLKPPFYIVKLGFTGVYIIFSFC